MDGILTNKSLNNSPVNVGRSNERETVVAVLVGCREDREVSCGERGGGHTGVKLEMELRMLAVVELPDWGLQLDTAATENTESAPEPEPEVSELWVSEAGLGAATSASGEMMMSA